MSDNNNNSILPMVFQTENLSYEDRQWAYQSKILGDCSAQQVSVKMKKYVAQNIESGPWKAIWRGNNGDVDFDVVVEVVDINVDELTADISLCDPVVCEPELPKKDIEELLINSYNNAVPLTDIYPIYDETGQNDDTALAIEHVRFFYEHIWREWDEDNDSDVSYTSHCLEQRLRLYYDIKDGLLPKDLVRKYQDNYAQYKNKYAELEQLRNKLADSDSDRELNDLDVLKCAMKTEECTTLVHSLEMMENSQMRYLLAAVSPGAKAALTRPKGQRNDGPWTMIVADKLMAYMVKQLPDDTRIEHFTDLTKALEAYHNGDTIHIYPGTYYLEDNMTLSDPVHIIGIGDSNRISVTCQDNDDIFIDCRSTGILFKNIMFEQEGEGSNKGMLVVRSGQTTLEDCQLNCGSIGVSVMRNGYLIMKNCKLYDAKSTGVSAQSEGKVHIENCDFYNCGDNTDDDAFNSSAAVQLQHDTDTKPDATLIDNTIHNNSGYGVCIVRSVSLADDNPECTINLDVTTNLFRGNKFGDVGHIYLDSSNMEQ